MSRYATYQPTMEHWAPEQKGLSASSIFMTVGAAFLFGAGVAFATAPAQSTEFYAPAMVNPAAMRMQPLAANPGVGPWAETGKELTGRIVSTKMDKTVVVDVERRVVDSRYHKTKRQNKRFKAHDEINQYKDGEMVMIRETRPLSKDKHFIVVGRLTPSGEVI